jgi:hypothetical protein
MPIRWTINHSERLVDAVLDGEISQEDTTKFFDGIESADAIPYRKLIDATKTSAKIDEKILAIAGERMARNQSRSPIAVVVPATGPIDGLARLFLLVAVVESDRARVFRDAAAARQWLDTRK